MFKGEKNNQAGFQDVSFFIECPCGCERMLPIEFTSKLNEAKIPHLGNQIWHQLVSENGFEGAIEFLHEVVDI